MLADVVPMVRFHVQLLHSGLEGQVIRAVEVLIARRPCVVDQYALDRAFEVQFSEPDTQFVGIEDLESISGGHTNLTVSEMHSLICLPNSQTPIPYRHPIGEGVSP